MELIVAYSKKPAIAPTRFARDTRNIEHIDMMIPAVKGVRPQLCSISNNSFCKTEQQKNHVAIELEMTGLNFELVVC
jgi:hypothetical protein